MPYSAYGTKSIANDSNGLEIHTGSQNETNEYLAKRTDIYKDPNPQIIRRPATDGSRTYEQRILVRYLQPPEVPPPGVIGSLFFVSVHSTFPLLTLASDYPTTIWTTTSSTTSTSPDRASTFSTHATSNNLAGTATDTSSTNSSRNK